MFPIPWCADISDGSNPQFGPNGRVHAVPFGGIRDVTDGSYGVRRGGCWFFSATNLRATHRYIIIPTARSADLGFRLARPYP
jgi:formylglycine-generating enzyme required for sulfatase activity